MNDFNAAVSIGSVIGRCFFTTWQYASARVVIAKKSSSQYLFSEVDDFAAALHVMYEHAGMKLPTEPVVRMAFATNQLDILDENDPFQQFLHEFHDVLRPVAMVADISLSSLTTVKTWVAQQLAWTPDQAFDHYSAS